MNLSAALSLLRLNGLLLAGLGVVLVVFSVSILSYLHNLVLQLLVGSFLIAPFMGAALCAIGLSLSHWARATFLLPLPSSARILIVWWARVLAPTTFAWVLVVLTLAITSTRSLSWISVLMAFAIPFASSSCWFLVSASAGAGYWTYCSRKGPARKFLATLRSVSFASFPFVLAPRMEMEQVGVSHGLALVILGVVFCALGLRRLYVICIAEPSDLIESRPTNAPGGNAPRAWADLRGFKLLAKDMFTAVFAGMLPVMVLFLGGNKLLQFLGVLKDTFPSFLTFFSFITLILLPWTLGPAFFRLRALRALPFNAGQISLRLSVMVAVTVLCLGALIAVLTLVLYDSGPAIRVFSFWLGGSGLLCCFSFPAVLHIGPNAPPLRQFLVLISTMLPVVIWFIASETVRLIYLVPIGLTLVPLGLGLSWLLTRTVIVRSSRAYTSNEPFSPVAMCTGA